MYPKTLYKLGFDTDEYDKLKISELKRQADHWSRRYLLAKAKRGQYNKIYCPFVNGWYNEKDIQICHFIDRGTIHLRYDEDNCILGSKFSNVWEAKRMVEGHRSLHHKKFAEILGEKKVKKLLESSKELIIFGREDYIEKIEKFKEYVRSKQ